MKSLLTRGPILSYRRLEIQLSFSKGRKAYDLDLAHGLLPSSPLAMNVLLLKFYPDSFTSLPLDIFFKGKIHLPQ